MNSPGLPRRLNEVSNLLGSLSFEIFHWFNHGKFSIYDLIEYLLLCSGKAHLKITSFSLSEEAIRKFIFFKEQELIDTAAFLFDHSTARNKLSLMLFISKSFAVRLSNNHTKIILIRNDLHHLVVSCSANLNQNLRHENGFISTDLGTYTLFDTYFDTVFQKALPYS